MKLPIIQGLISRRILVNYRIDPDVAARILPEPFRPQLYDGWAIGGVCLIRLSQIRPKGLPAVIGISSENAAYRFAVEWDDSNASQQGVYVPLRLTNSRLNATAGGRIFPGLHRLAKFAVDESNSRYAIEIESKGDIEVSLIVHESDHFAKDSIFASLTDASSFFEAGSVGYSETRQHNHFDGLVLRCTHWDVNPTRVEQARIAYFADPDIFPPGSIELDCALLMREIPHEWHAVDKLTANT